MLAVQRHAALCATMPASPPRGCAMDAHPDNAIAVKAPGAST